MLEGDFGCCFVFCLSSIVTDLKECWVFPVSCLSPAFFLQYSWIFYAVLPFLFILQLTVMSKQNQSLLRCVSQTCWASSIALHVLPEKILSLAFYVLLEKLLTAGHSRTFMEIAGSMGHETVLPLSLFLSWTVPTAGVLPLCDTENDRWSWNFILSL